MANLNKVILAGNLVRDTELSYLPNNTPLAQTALAINKKWKDASGQQREEVCFIDLKCFGKMAETLQKYTSKGKPLLVVGELRQESWETKDGQKRSKHVINVTEFQFLGGRDDAAPRQSPTPPPAANSYAGFDGDFGGGAGNDDIPFAPMENI